MVWYFLIPVKRQPSHSKTHKLPNGKLPTSNFATRLLPLSATVKGRIALTHGRGGAGAWGRRRAQVPMVGRRTTVPPMGNGGGTYGAGSGAGLEQRDLVAGLG